MHEGEIADGEFLVPGGDAPWLFEAAHAPLDALAPTVVLTVETQRAPAPPLPGRPLPTGLRNGRHDVAAPQRPAA